MLVLKSIGVLLLIALPGMLFNQWLLNVVLDLPGNEYPVLRFFMAATVGLIAGLTAGNYYNNRAW